MVSGQWSVVSAKWYEALVMYMIDSSGSSIGLEDSSCAGGMSSLRRVGLGLRLGLGFGFALGVRV